MVKLFELVGNAMRQDLNRVVNNELVPRRGKKKHGTQMTKKEKTYLFTKLKSIEKWRISNHALERIKEKGIEITYDDVVTTIHNSTIIEYHVLEKNNMKEERVLLRAKSVLNKMYNLHFVYNITGKSIVSSWLNEITDQHDTLDWRDYSKDIQILS